MFGKTDRPPNSQKDGKKCTQIFLMLGRTNGQTKRRTSKLEIVLLYRIVAFLLIHFAMKKNKLTFLLESQNKSQ